MVNALANPSFETDASGWSVTGAGTLTRVVGSTVDGSAFGRYASTGGTIITSALVAATPGQVWSAGGYFRKNAGTSRNLRVDIQWLAADGTTVLSTALGPAAATPGASYARQVNENNLAPASTAFARVRVVYVSAASGDSYDLDALQLEQAASLPAYFQATRTGTLSAAPAFTATAGEVEVVSAPLSAAPAFTATTREVEVITGTLTAAPVFSGTTVEVEAPVTGTLTAAAAFTATGVQVVSRTGSLTAAPAFTATGEVVIPSGGSVTITIGTWSQTWVLGEDLDEDDVEMINAEGCVLDGLRAAWSSEGLMTQPGPTVTQFVVYVPAGAVGPPLDEGAECSILVEPRNGSHGAFLPLVETLGKISDGSAVPLRDGLAYSVIVTDHLADLGETRIGGRGWDAAWAHDRVNRVTEGMAADGQTLLWETKRYLLTTYPEYVDTGLIDIDPMDWATEDPMWLWMGPGPQGPVFRDRPSESLPTNEVLDQLLRDQTKWGPQVVQGSSDYVRIFAKNPTSELIAHPEHREWTSLYARPIVYATETPGFYRVAWTSPRVPGSRGGLPLRLVVDEDGVGTLRAKASEGLGVTTTRYSCWIPGSAIPKDGVTWAVNKDSHPRQARATGWWEVSGPYDQVGASADYLVGYPSDEISPAEAQVDLPEISADVDSDEFLSSPAAIAWSLVGWPYDAEPRYELAQVEFRYQAIGDPDDWPRLFQDPHQSSTDYFAAAQGRFVFVHSIADKWHPYGRDFYWGFLTGASLTVEGGRITGSAELAHRMPGPCGPAGVPTGDGVLGDRWKLLTGSTPGAGTWAQAAADPDLSALTWADFDPALTAVDLTMTTK